MMRQEDDITAAIRKSADHWYDVLLEGDDDLAKRIHDLGIDVLVDLAGHTAYNRLPVFALKPAPVQATWVGYFHSTGLKSIDYFITDPYTSPLACGQLFSETPVWLPHSRFCYAPPDYAPAVAPPPVLARGYPTFGCFNRLEKLVAPVFAAWAEILRAVHESRLLLKAGTLADESLREHVRRRFAEHGIPSERLELRGPSGHADMFVEYGDIDIALDPFPFNGGMTTLEALWMGVPVVALKGSAVVSRQSHSVLANLGLHTELVFGDIDSYVAGAIALARDHGRLAKLREEIRPRMAASPLCQPEQFCRELEGLYRRMWQAYCEGEKLPSSIA
jgi:predicted O-linked N-acetylglucosamine transferase (SPINDLY family)